MRSRLLFQDFCAGAFILLWGYTALSKVFDFQETVVQLSKSPLIGSLATIVAIALPAIEFVLVGLLLAEKTKRVGLYFSLALMVAFTTYLIVLLNFSYYIPCACGGIFGHGIMWNGRTIFKLDWQGHIIFNLAFIILGILNILLPSEVLVRTKSELPKIEPA